MMIKVNLFLAILRIRTITSFKLNTGSANIIINFLIKLKNLWTWKTWLIMNSEEIGKLAFIVVYVNVRFPIPVTDNYTMTTDIQKKNNSCTLYAILKGVNFGSHIFDKSSIFGGPTYMVWHKGIVYSSLITGPSILDLEHVHYMNRVMIKGP